MKEVPKQSVPLIQFFFQKDKKEYFIFDVSTKRATRIH